MALCHENIVKHRLSAVPLHPDKPGDDVVM